MWKEYLGRRPRTVFLSVVAALLGSLMTAGAEQFVEVKAQIEINSWNYWFFADGLKDTAGAAAPTNWGIFPTNHALRCVVGLNTWMIETAVGTTTTTWWFTGTNVVEYTLFTRETPRAGEHYTRIHDATDGNPGRPVRVADLMGFALPAKIDWLAFCSGGTLKREGRRIFPPDAFWKETTLVYSGWSDKTTTFSDGLGLPKSIILLSTNAQPVFRYQVHQSTNILGWTFPLEFYLVQYWPRPDYCEVDLTGKGRVTAIKPTTKPEIPPEVWEKIDR